MAASSNEAIIYNYLINDLGFTPAGAAGALGNLQVESGFSPTAANPGEGAIGIAQWEKGRRSALDAYASKTGGSETSLLTQLGYLAQELKGSFSGVLAAMRTATDPGTAAAEWDTNYEISSGSTHGQRISNAQTIYQQINTGKALTGGGSASFASSGNGGGLAGGAPYNPNSLHAPLTAAQRAAIIAWILSGPDGGSVSIDRAAIEKASDAELIAAYKSLYQMVSAIGPSLLPNNPLTSWQNTIIKYVIKSLFTLGGIGLVVLGGYAAAQPARQAAASMIPVGEL